MLLLLESLMDVALHPVVDVPLEPLPVHSARPARCSGLCCPWHRWQARL